MSETPRLDVSTFFSLSRASYFVMPRLALEALPSDWQDRFVRLMSEAESMGLETPSDYKVYRQDKASGRFIADPWADYRRGRATEICPSFRPPV